MHCLFRCLKSWRAVWLCLRLMLSACERGKANDKSNAHAVICLCGIAWHDAALAFGVDSLIAVGMQHSQLQMLEMMAQIEKKGYQPLLLRLRLQLRQGSTCSRLASCRTTSSSMSGARLHKVQATHDFRCTVPG